MPLGNNNSNLTYLSFDKVEMRLKTKKNNVIELYDYVEGKFMGIRWAEGTYENRPANKWVVTIMDSEGAEYLLQFSDKAIYGGGLLNSLMSVKPFQKIRITPYARNGKDGQQYLGVAVTDPSKPRDNNLITFKYDFKEEVPFPEAVQVNGQDFIQDGRVVRNHQPVIDFWKSKVELKKQEFNASVDTDVDHIPDYEPEFVQAPTKPSAPKPTKTNTNVPAPKHDWSDMVGDDDDLPF